MRLVAEGVRLAFADSNRRAFTVLDVPRFAPEAGRVTTIEGASGSGKSTLLYVLGGLLPLDDGRVLFDGKDILAQSESRRDAWRRTHIGFVFQDFHLIPDLSPIANAALPATFGRAAGVAARARRLLTELRVPDRASIDQVSRGERQRVAIARALAFDPPVILADEPTASLDREATAEVAAILSRLASEGRTVIVATHDADLHAGAHHRFRLDHGRLTPLDAPAAA